VAELVDVDGLSVADAAALRIRVGTARVRLHRARHRLVAQSGNCQETLLEGSS
jgi:RNA polymerase sigma-70 factor (ECF subfamily)